MNVKATCNKYSNVPTQKGPWKVEAEVSLLQTSPLPPKEQLKPVCVLEQYSDSMSPDGPEM